MFKTKILLIIGAVILAGVGGLTYYGVKNYNQILNSAVGDGKSQIFHIESGESGSSVAARLKTAGLIKDATVFNLYLKQAKLTNKIKAGDYLLAPSMTEKQIVTAVTEGNVAVLRVTIPEGFKLAQITDRLDNQAVVRKADFQAALKADWTSFKAVAAKPKSLDLEGYLFPDTYTFPYGVKASEVVRLMLANLESKLSAPDIQAGLTAKKLTAHQALTLASVIEAESRFAEDRPKIAEVFLNRLARGMALESDVTVAYAVGKSAKDLVHADFSVNSPYNTYKSAGLPPGPIDSPGLSSIQAIFHQGSAFTDGKTYLYFCASKTDGRVYYAVDLAGHQANVSKYCS